MQHIVERTAPYWVHKNIAHSEQHHDHLRFGQPVTRVRRVRDENGDLVFEPVMKTVTLREAMSGSVLTGYPARPEPIPEQVQREAKKMRSRGSSLNDTISYDTGKMRQKRETVVVGHYADWCTIGEEMDRDGALMGDPTTFLPCVSWPSNYGDEKVYPRNPAEKLWDAPVARVNTRARSRALARAANSGIDLDELEGDC